MHAARTLFRSWTPPRFHAYTVASLLRPANLAAWMDRQQELCASLSLGPSGAGAGALVELLTQHAVEAQQRQHQHRRGVLDGRLVFLKDNLLGGAASRMLPAVREQAVNAVTVSPGQDRRRQTPSCGGSGGGTERGPGEEDDGDRHCGWVWRQLVQQQGMVPCGSANMDEFGMGGDGSRSPGWRGPTVNPFHAGYSAGGSSGGIAAAVASGCAEIGVGSDTGGSVRQPAASCGLWGFKPSYGAVSRHGLTAYASSLDCVGWVARHASLLEPVFRALATHRDPLDPTHQGGWLPEHPQPPPVVPESRVVGIPIEYSVEELSPAVRAAWEAALQELQQRGFRTVEVSLPHTALALPSYYVIACAEASSNLSRYDGSHCGSTLSGWSALAHDPGNEMDFREFEELNRSRGFGVEVLRRILTGTSVLSLDSYERFFKQAQIARHLVARDFMHCFDSGVDFLLTPVVPQPALPLPQGECSSTGSVTRLYEFDCCTVPASLAGLPAISVPVQVHGAQDGALPLGVQLIGRPRGDLDLLQLACFLDDGGDRGE